jgi:hypothetical protein
VGSFSEENPALRKARKKATLVSPLSVLRIRCERPLPLVDALQGEVVAGVQAKAGLALVQVERQSLAATASLLGVRPVPLVRAHCGMM